MKKLKGFTLSETLIVLGIIGIIAALTIPTVISDYKNKTYVTTLQKLYNQLSDAGIAMLADSRVDSLSDTSMTELNGVGNFLNKYFRVVKDCGVSENNDNECLASSYQTTDQSKAYTPASANRYCVTTNIGASICMRTMGDSSQYYHGYSDVIVDVNGVKGPNILGRDLFGFEFYSDAKISEGYSGLNKIDYCNDSTFNDGGYATGCFSKIMHDGWKMDY